MKHSRTIATKEDDHGGSEAPGVPGFRTWGRVYLFVLGWFAFLVILLTVFTRWFA